MRRIALPLVALAGLLTAFLWVGRWPRGGGGDARATSVAWPGPPPSHVVGSADAPTGGLLVVGVLVPSAPPRRLKDLVPNETWSAFLADEAARAADRNEPITGLSPAVEELPSVDVDQGPFDPDIERARRRRMTFTMAARAVESASRVRVVFRHLRASECEGVPLILVDGAIEHEGDARRLASLRASGTLVVATTAGRYDAGEVDATVLPDAIDASVPLAPPLVPLVERCLAVLRSSSVVHRLAADPVEITSARREGDDVVLRLAVRPTAASLRDLDDRIVATIDPGHDGTMRFHCPDPALDPRTHRIVVESAPVDGQPIRRAWTVFELVGTTERVVLAPNRTEAGAIYAPRALFLNTKSGEPVVGRSERIAIVAGSRILAEAQSSSDAQGSLDVSLHVPEDAPVGPASLRVGDDTFVIDVRSGVTLSVVTDRTIYRPTDEVHVRLMAHRAATGRPVAGVEITLRVGSIEQRVKSSAHGIASARFALYDATLGSTDVEAKALDATGTANFVVRAFETPTFGVRCEPATLSMKPSESAPMSVVVRYIGGGPVVGAHIDAWTTGRGQIEPSSGVTDAQGRFAAVVLAPARARACEVTFSCQDADGRRIEASIPVTVVGAPRDLGPWVELTPLDEPIVGRPCRIELKSSEAGRVSLGREGQEKPFIDVDSAGVVVVTITPLSTYDRMIASIAGSTQEVILRAVEFDSARLGLLLERRTWTVGETLVATVSGPDGPAYLDVARHGSTLLARSVRVRDGRGHVSLPIDGDLAGVLDVRVWRRVGGNPVGSTARVLVTRGRSLTVRAQATRDAWRPGERAAVDVDVIGRDGRPTAGVLGYWGVDEAVLAIAPWHESREEIFDLLPPRDRGPLGGIARRHELGREVRYAAAREALGAPEAFDDLGEALAIRHRTEPVNGNVVAKAARDRFVASLSRLRAVVIESFGRVPIDEIRTASSLSQTIAFLVERGWLDVRALDDAWGTPLAFGPAALDRWDESSTTERDNLYHSWRPGFRVLCAGPDLAWNTADDLDAVWEPVSLSETDGVLGRCLAFLGRHGVTLEGFEGDRLFIGPSNNGLIGLGGGAGGAFKGRGGHRNLRAGGGGRRAVEPVHVRRDFKPTLCFVPEAIVGPDGKAHLEIPLRDSITSWRLRLVASAADGATGVGETSIRVTQPLHVAPWIAPYLTVGDELDLPVAVRNETAADTDVALALSASSGIAVLGESQARVAVGPHGTGSHTFRIRAVAPGAMSVRVDATSATAQDAIERVIDVRRLARAVVETVNQTVSADSPFTAAILASTPELPTDHRVSFYSSPLADVIGGFEGLIACPHG